PLVKTPRRSVASLLVSPCASTITTLTPNFFPSSWAHLPIKAVAAHARLGKLTAISGFFVSAESGTDIETRAKAVKDQRKAERIFIVVGVNNGSILWSTGRPVK